ncbi:MAG: GNAT family N-acetyltransferase [Cyanobacteriota bacterium]|nr:GNAT family N-acetyltransferase [Cyanobacteriota bacterium]
MAAPTLAELQRAYPEKFAGEEEIFAQIPRGARLFIASACGEPQYLVRALVNYVQNHPKAIYDAEVLQIWTLGLAPYADSKLQRHFRHNSFFIGQHTRSAVNEGLADYTPIFLSQVPGLFRQGRVPIDVAFIQTSYPDAHGYVNLGVSVDIVKAAAEAADLVVAQMNRFVPRIQGDGFLSLGDLDFIIPWDEPLLEYLPGGDEETGQKVGAYVARLVRDGDTLQVGYGNLPNQVLKQLGSKKNLGVHTELLTPGILDLMKTGAVDGSRKTRNRGKVVATFSLGDAQTYSGLNDHPAVEFRTADYTNNALIIAQHDNFVAINGALQIDLTGQATAESLGSQFYSGIGGQADFMRGALLAKGGRSILTLESSAEGETVSRIVPFLPEGSGVTLNRGDVHYVATEYGIAYLHGKNIRERALELIAVAHPKFRGWLMEEAKQRRLIYADQAFISGQGGEYPEGLERYQTTRQGEKLLLRPVKISDEPKLKSFFYSLSDESLRRRFFSVRKDMPHRRLQEFAVIDYSQEMVLLALQLQEEQEILVGLAQYALNEDSYTAEVAVVVRDDWQNQGVATALLRHLTLLAKKQGLLGFSAEVLLENRAMIQVFEKLGLPIRRRMRNGVYALTMPF